MLDRPSNLPLVEDFEIGLFSIHVEFQQFELQQRLPAVHHTSCAIDRISKSGSIGFAKCC